LPHDRRRPALGSRSRRRLVLELIRLLALLAFSSAPAALATAIAFDVAAIDLLNKSAYPFYETIGRNNKRK
jgi:hypothetical protein